MVHLQLFHLCPRRFNLLAFHLMPITVSLDKITPTERLRVGSAKPTPEELQKAWNEALREHAQAIQTLAKAVRELQALQ